MMRFANPEALQWLWLVPFLGVCVWYWQRRGKQKMQRAFGGRLADYLGRSLCPKRRRIKWTLKFFALSFFVLAWARPQVGQSLQEVKSQGVEIVIAMDVSTSMLAEDVKPSRLQHAKAEVSRLLDLLVGNKVGLVAFAGSSVLLSPLTTDQSALKIFIDSVSTESVETQGTDFRRALNEARSAFQRGGIESEETTRVTRVVLVLSDGEDQEEGALEEAKKMVSDEGIRVFTVAFGTERGGAIPQRDERGYLRSYKRDRGGKNVLTVVKGDFLRKLAKVGQGSFYHSTFGGHEMNRIRADIDKLEKSEFSSSLAMTYDEKFQFFLALGLILAMIDLLLGERRPEGRLWKGQYEVAER